MIIWGWRGVTTTKDTGDFFCPECNADATYRHRKVRNFFTLYFIPLIPLNELGTFVECDHCKNGFREEVLELDPRRAAVQFVATYQEAMKSVMVEMMRADGEIDADEISTIQKIYRKLTGQELTPDDVLSHEPSESFLEELEAIAPQMNNEGKEKVIKAAYYVAAADGVFADEERDFIVEVADAIDMSRAHLKGVIADCSERSKVKQ
ncbi:TerB family tellurite resistance protein [Stratiformator vulcanicus]|uniref:Tellurite resistance protein TerB n=1 Tax=Stratiformator vulcanicus TaxID=2527980 RepID=A0A517R2U7_9PLAN|nr:TerB family tellurite resistance protein [Stratiformator vulcanicus]QDT38202.1 Tellurite resistance protein TerB [Stratiformator vulcanicus]